MDAGIGVKVGIIGCGNLGSSLIRGFLEAGILKAEEMVGSDVDEGKIKRVGELGIKTTMDNRELVKLCDVVIIAVKPDLVESVLKETKKVSGGKLFISVAAGISAGFIEARTMARVVRVMPNICGAVKEMASCFSPGSRVSERDRETVKKLLGGLGKTYEIDERLMDVVTGLSGSGPAYFYYIVKAMQDAGVELGLPPEVALKLVAQTAKGAGEMILRGDKTLDELTKQVCTPGGTTIEGIKVLERRKVADSLREAIKAATRRAKELSR